MDRKQDPSAAPPWQPRRAVGVLALAGALVASLAAVNGLMLAAFGAEPTWLSPSEKPPTWSTYEKLGAKLAAVEAERLDVPLGVVIGQSTVVRAFDPEILAERDPAGRRWLALGAGGVSFTKVENVVRALAASDLRPQVAVLGVHASWLVGESGAEVDTGQDRHSAWNWTGRYRKLLNNMIRGWLYWKRIDLLRGLGSSIGDVFPSDGAPWEPLRTVAERMSEHARTVQLARFEGYGWFEAERYEEDAAAAQAAALVRLVTALRNDGAEVRIALMPERSTLRERLPAEAVSRLHAVLESAFGSQAPPVLDFRTAMTDEHFDDCVHLFNSPGRGLFSELFMDRLAADLASAEER